MTVGTAMRDHAVEDMQRRIPDCTRALNQIGFSPTRTLDDIISAVIADRRS